MEGARREGPLHGVHSGLAAHEHASNEHASNELLPYQWEQTSHELLLLLSLLSLMWLHQDVPRRLLLLLLLLR